MDLLSAPPDVEVVLCWIPCPDASSAATIGRKAVEARLAACANIVPGMTSIYRWNGAIQTESETLLVMKSTAHNRDRLTDLVRSAHPYEIPAISFLPVTGGFSGYLEWVVRETMEPGETIARTPLPPDDQQQILSPAP